MPADNKDKLKKGMGLLDLVLFNVVAIVGLRWAAVAAGVGPSSLWLWLLAMVLFFIPSALVVTEMSSKCPSEGGIYVWTREAFGEFHGYICGFFYWVNNVIYYPNLMIFLAGVFLYGFGDRYLHLEKSPVYTVIFSLIVLWAAMIVNMFGVKTGKWFQNLGSLGSWVPAGALLIMGVIAWVKYGPANDLSFRLPKELFKMDTLSVFANLCFGFAGMELQACMGEEIESPSRNIPRAIFISGIAIALIYVLSTAAILVVLPVKQVNVISGVVQVIASVAKRLNVVWVGMVIAFFLSIGGIGGIGAWMTGTARIPFVIGIDNYLPPWMAKIHPKWGTPVNALLVQGGIVTFFILMNIGSTVKDTYLMLVDATIILYFIPYLYLFTAFMKWKKKTPRCDLTGNKKMDYPWWLGLVGLLTTAFAIVMTLIPGKDIKNPMAYEIKLVGGVLIFFVLGWMMFHFAQKRIKKQKEDVKENPSDVKEDD